MIRAICLAVVSALLWSPNVIADVVHLTSGEKIEGKILSEDEGSVRIEVKVSASITDERTVLRAEVEKIEKPQPDEQAHVELAALRLDPQRTQSMPWYDETIRRFEEFKAAFPASAKIAETDARLAEIKAERDRVKLGDLRMSGKWYTKEEVEKRGDELKGIALLEGMKAQAGSGDLAGAMATFERIEAEASDLPAYPEAVGLAAQVLKSLQAAVDRNLAAIAREKTRVEGDLKKLSEVQRQQAVSALGAEKLRRDRAVEASKAKWKPFIPRSETSMAAYKKAIEPERRRLEQMKVDDLRTAVSRMDAARAALAAGNPSAAAAAAGEAAKLWPKNAAIKKLADEIKSAQNSPKSLAQGDEESDGADGDRGTGGKKKGDKTKPGGDGEEKPFYMTLKGALMILGGIVALVAIGSLAGRMKGKGDRQ